MPVARAEEPVAPTCARKVSKQVMSGGVLKTVMVDNASCLAQWKAYPAAVATYEAAQAADATFAASVKAGDVVVANQPVVWSTSDAAIATVDADDPERLSGVVAARRKEPVAVVVVTTNGPGDWLENAAELPAEVPVFVLLPAGDLPPDLEIVDGRPAWVS